MSKIKTASVFGGYALDTASTPCLSTSTSGHRPSMHSSGSRRQFCCWKDTYGPHPKNYGNLFVITLNEVFHYFSIKAFVKEQEKE